MAGEIPDQIWQNFYHVNVVLQRDPRTILHRYGTACTAQGCHRCTNPDCFYADFIRNYWNHPGCD
jgi:hypothetical protein